MNDMSFLRPGLQPLLLTALVALTIATGALPAAAMGKRSVTPRVGHLAIYLADSVRYNYAEVTDALDRSGYEIVSVTDTMLNRVKIRARNPYHLREIVVSRASGAILRDGLVESYATPQAPPLVPIEQIIQDSKGGIRVHPD
jgi:hypothetical protein